MQFGQFSFQKPQVYEPDPSGKCIYCGSKAPEGGLSREHIIAFGLGGGLILRGASCSKCRDVTAAIETKCLHEMFLAYRTHFRLPTYRKKKRPDRFPLVVNYGTHREKRYVPLDDHPNVLALPYAARHHDGNASERSDSSSRIYAFW